MMMCIIIVAIFVLRIPIPFTQGYVNLSDGIIFIAIFILDKKHSVAAASLGCMMGDILSGFAFWAPWTLVIKSLMAFVTGLIMERSSRSHKHSNSNDRLVRLAAMAAGGILMCAGYLAAETVMYGSFALAIPGLPWNIGQVIAGMVLSMSIYSAIAASERHK